MKVILWDIDGTILNFIEAEKAAIRMCFLQFHLGKCTDEMITRYSAINKSYWERLEREEISKPELLVGRFRDFFRQERISLEERMRSARAEQSEDDLLRAFNAQYQIRLGDTICFNDNAYELIRQLKGKVKQYAVTNGTRAAQERKLENSGLNPLFDGVFISEDVGVEKPNNGFFDYVFRQIGPYKNDEVMIVGDSLTSDIKGGNNAGILCCWYHPQKVDQQPAGQESMSREGTERKNPTIQLQNLRIDYEIQNLWQVKEILAI